MLILIDEKNPTVRRKFSGHEVGIGRIADNDLALPVAHISSRHARIRSEGQRYVIADLGSTNGTMVLRGEERLLLGPKGADEVALEEGDVLVLGDIDQPERWRVEIVLEPAGFQTIVASRASGETVVAARRVGAEGQLIPLLLRLAEGLAAAESPKEVYTQLAKTTLEALPSVSDVLVSEAGSGNFRLLARTKRGAGISDQIDATICHTVVARGEALLFGQQSAAMPAETLVAGGLGTGLAAPLIVSHGSSKRVAAVLLLLCPPERLALGDLQLDLAVVLAHQAAVALQRAELFEQLQRAEARLREENAFLRASDASLTAPVAESPLMQRALTEAQKAAASDVTVLLHGETGTGKEVFARLIHESGRRRERLLVPVNCGALTETLLDSELFGHKKGAFTGATHDRKGVFELAHGGTVFLDEIGETPAALQVRLLRVLEEGKIKRVGETTERSVDVRLIAATNRDLAQMVKEGCFRQDLYYRLRVFPLRLPPLRERPEDIEPLTRRFVERFTRQLGKHIPSIDPQLFALFRRYAFPGNVRELVNEIERAVVRADDGQPLAPELLSEEILAAGLDPRLEPKPGATLKELVNHYEAQLIGACLARNEGHKSAAAEELGLTRQGLAKKIARLGIG